MSYNPEIHHRHSIRLKGYDYAQEGLYFVTICVQNKTCLFGNIENAVMVLNDAGTMVKNIWDDIPSHYFGIKIDAYVIMPNHFHGIIQILGEEREGQAQGLAPTDMNVGAGPCACPPQAPNVGAGPCACPPQAPNVGAGPCACPPQAPNVGAGPCACPPQAPLTLPEIVKRFKSLTTRRYIIGVHSQQWPPFSGRLWQRNYYDRIIRDEEAYHEIAEYIWNNPQSWQDDQYFVA